MDNQAIGIIDSGVGGLTVARQVMKQLPQETIYYFADNLRCPYGSRSNEEIQQFTFEMIQYLLRYPLKAIVIACNTITAAVLDKVQKKVDIPVIGVIEPGVKAAIQASQRGQIGLIGTESTVQSQVFDRLLKQYNPSSQLVSLACPTFVEWVEEGKWNHPDTDAMVHQVLQPLSREDIDTLILGCTHFPWLSNSIQKVFGDSVQLIHAADETVKELLTKIEVVKQDQQPTHRFFTTGSRAGFSALVKECMAQGVAIDVIHVDIGALSK